VKIINSALDDFIQARTKDPAYAVAWAGIADANLELYRLKRNSLYADQAKAAAEQAYHLNSKVPEVQLALGSVYAEIGRRSEAIELLKQAVNSNPNSDNAHLRLGRAYLLMGKDEEAIEQYRKAIEINEYSWYNHDQLARAYFRLGQNEKALRHFNKAAEYNSRNAEVHENIGIIYSRQSRWPRCIEEFHKALKIKPTASTYSNLGTALFVTGRYAEAASMFQKAVEMNPEKYWFFGNMADAYRHSNQYEKAQEAYDHAIELASQQLQINPQKAEILGDLALYYAKKGGLAGLDEAREKIARARSIDPHNNALMYIEGVIYAIGGDKDKAFNSIREALRNGYSAEEVRRDSDLAPIRAMPEFRDLIKDYPVVN
jgi:serine/threonine-protein kinase